MSVDFDAPEAIANRVWLDRASGALCVEIDGRAASLDFAAIPGDDFESTTPIVGFAVSCEGTVVVCRHENGAETWLPVDMWLPGGFTPA
jgi:hypothetical protein